MQCNSLAMSWLSSVLRHVLWSSIEHLTRRCHHPGRCDDSHCSGVEGYAPWEASLSRSDWAQSPQSGAAARQLNHRWCWDTWRSRALGCWIPSDCHIHKERSGSRNKTWHPYRGMFCGEDSFQRDQYFTLCLPKLTSASFAHNPWVCDSDWGPMPFETAPLWRASPWVSLWLTLGTVPFKAAPLWRASPWVSLWLTLGMVPLTKLPALWRASPWVSLWLALGRCLSRLHLSGEHHLGWVCDSHWGTMPLQTAPLWRASPWVSLWLTLGRVAFQDCTSLASITFGWVCDSHWARCLWGCTSLASITLGESVTHVGDGAFAAPLWRNHCESVTHIGYAFDTSAFGWVCDSHWGRCLWKLHLSGEHHLGWVCDSHWGRCLSKLHLSGEHHLGWVCDSFSKLSLFGEHHLGWVCDSDWGRCLSKLHLAGEHHNSRVIGRECEKSIAEPFCGSHHASCIAGQETTTRGVSESTAKQWV